MRLKHGFTLIELLVTLAVIGLLVTIAAFSLSEAMKSGRDGKRKADLENIAIGLELYRADCNAYPGSLTMGGSLAGTGTPASCAAGNVYIASIAQDPQYSTSGPRYSYTASGGGYVLCGYLEQPPNPAVSVTGCGSCGGASYPCRWKVSRP